MQAQRDREQTSGFQWGDGGAIWCGRERWTIKRAEHRRIDTFEL